MHEVNLHKYNSAGILNLKVIPEAFLENFKSVPLKIFIFMFFFLFYNEARVV